MKINKDKSSITIIIILAVFIIALVSLLFFLKYSSKPTTKTSYVECKGQAIPFRADATACKNALFASENEFLGILLNPEVKEVRILLNPNGSAGLGLSAYEIQKALNTMLIQCAVAYTEAWPDQPEVPIMSIGHASVEYPIIWLRENRDESKVTISSSSITFEAITQADLDAVTCRAAFALLNTAHDCKFVEK